MGNYAIFSNTSGNNGYTVTFSASKGGESAGTVANNSSSSSYKGGESAGTVAGSFGGSSCASFCCGSFTAIA